MTAPHDPSRTGDDTPRRTLDLSPIQVAAGALAAVTAAILASGLGVAGTVAGAAAVSMVTTVGTALYRASLERSRERVRALAQRTRPLPAGDRRAGQPTAAFPDRPGAPPHGAEQPTGRGAPAAADPSRRGRRVRWGAALAAAVGVFALAMLLITGYEWASGQTLGGHGSGTTVGRLVGSSGPLAPLPVPDDPTAPGTDGGPDTPTPTVTSEAPAPNPAPGSGDTGDGGTGDWPGDGGTRDGDTGDGGTGDGGTDRDTGDPPTPTQGESPSGAPLPEPQGETSGRR